MTDDASAAGLAGLSPTKLALLERRLASRRERTRPTIPRHDPQEPVQLSFAQWRLWFLEQLRPGTHTWNTPIAARLSGPLDYSALRGALEIVVRRHSPLHTVFVTRAGQPEPVPVLKDGAVPFAVVDVDGRDVER